MSTACWTRTTKKILGRLMGVMHVSWIDQAHEVIGLLSIITYYGRLYLIYVVLGSASLDNNHLVSVKWFWSFPLRQRLEELLNSQLLRLRISAPWSISTPLQRTLKEEIIHLWFYSRGYVYYSKVISLVRTGDLMPLSIHPYDLDQNEQAYS